jgi:hypothetical protein
MKAFASTAPVGIAAQMDEQLRLGKNQNGLLLFQRSLTDSIFTRLKEAIPNLVSVANGLVDDGFTKPGMFVFFMVNTAYPGIPEVEEGLVRAQEVPNDQKGSYGVRVTCQSRVIFAAVWSESRVNSVWRWFPRWMIRTG